MNLVAPFLLVRAVLPHMIERGNGHIVSEIGSAGGPLARSPRTARTPPPATALRGLHQVMRAELRGTGVRTTLVSPASVDTTIGTGVDPAAPLALSLARGNARGR